ncbi:MAG: hypothetical protein ACREN8_09260 [Candidatus Dormibacteraceae bacterium]
MADSTSIHSVQLTDKLARLLACQKTIRTIDEINNAHLEETLC